MSEDEKHDTTPHEPTETTRKLVQLHSTTGTPQPLIAALLGIDPKTLRKYYRAELDLATAQANAVAAGKLFDKVKTGDLTALIFWLKTRAGWKETTRIETPGQEEVVQFFNLPRNGRETPDASD